MLTEHTLVAEVTGIMGAGYPPGLLPALAKHLRASFYVVRNGRPTELHTRHHVDNTLLLKKAPDRWRVADQLINRGGAPLTDSEIEQLAEISREVDDLILLDLAALTYPIDVVLRRGGVLQSYIHLKDPRFQRLRIERRLEPKFLFFVIADEETVRQSFARDAEFQRLREELPKSYTQNPTEALEQQARWLAAVQTHSGVIIVRRTLPDTAALVGELADKIASAGVLANFQTLRRASCFLSYSHHDTRFTNILFEELKRNGVDCSYFPEEAYAAGRPLWEAINESIMSKASVVVVASEQSLCKSDSVQKELSNALRLEESRQLDVLKLVALDSWVFDHWDHPRAGELRNRVVADFRGWETNPAAIQLGLRKLLEGLRRRRSR